MLKVFCLLLTSRSWNISSRRGSSQEKEEEEGQESGGWTWGAKRRGRGGSSNRGKTWTDGVRMIQNTIDKFQTVFDFPVLFVPVNRKEEKEEEKEGKRGGRRLRRVENVYIFSFTWVILVLKNAFISNKGNTVLSACLWIWGGESSCLKRNFLDFLSE